MGMERYDYRIPPLCLTAEILDLVRINIGCLVLDSLRQVDNYLLIRCRLPDLKNAVTDLNSKIEFRVGECLRRILEDEVRAALILVYPVDNHFRAICSKLNAFFAREIENNISVERACRIIKMDNDIRSALYGFHCLIDNVLSGLR